MISIWLLLVPLVVLISVVHYSLRNGISPTPSTRKQTRAILSLIPPDTTGRVYDLGSGWGTLALIVAKNFPKAQVTGYESSPIPYLISLLLAPLAPSRNLKFLRIDFLKASFSDAALVLCYLYPGAMRKLKTKFEKELRPGTLVISNTFSIPGWKPAQTVPVEDFFQSAVYVYEMPEGEI